MFQAAFDVETFAEIVPWLMLHRDGLVVSRPRQAPIASRTPSRPAVPADARSRLRSRPAR
jgi:hypothetical protein